MPCPSGYSTNVNGTACEPCMRGWYQSADGQQECVRCPNGTWTRHVASTSRVDCQGGVSMAPHVIKIQMNYLRHKL